MSRCEICNLKDQIVQMTCGHYYHMPCFQKHVSGMNWRLPCKICQKDLGHALYDHCLKQWYIGLDIGSQFHCYFKINSESKIVEWQECFSKWKRDNGRLLRVEMLPLKYNICVS
jgi:hypothetical protein